MKEFTARALDRARDLSASYADIRVVNIQQESITFRNGKVEALSGARPGLRRAGPGQRSLGFRIQFHGQQRRVRQDREAGR